MKALIVALTIFTLNLTLSASAFAMAGLSLVSAPDGKSLMIQASNFENVSAATIVINYDSSVAGNVAVNQGAFVMGAMFASNAKEPGTITIAVITTQGLSGSGPIATLNYQRKGSGAPNFTINRPKTTIIDSKLSPQAVTTSDTTTDTTPKGGGSTGNTDRTPTDPGYQASSSTATTNVVGGTVTMPSDMNQPEEKKAPQPSPEYKEEQPREPHTVAREATAPEAKAPEAEAKAPQLQVVPPVNVLDRFKAYKGEMTSQALLALFTPDEKATAKQEPAILFADGKANLKVTILNPQGKQAPNFALKKAKLVSLKMNPDSAWVVVAKPAKDAYEASITMLVDEAAVEIPLTLAPKVDVDLDKSGKVDDSDFKLFLKERGSDKAPKYDLNKDGRRDYIDDFIFTANFLALQTKAIEKPAPAKTTEKSDGGKQPIAPAAKSQK